MQQKNAFLALPELTIDADGIVRSELFSDVYFSKEGGAAETGHVFLKGNGLPERWRDREHFTIGELGFGTGLNFMVTKDMFEKTNARGRLHYVAVEKFPLSKAQLLKVGADALAESYPDRLPGIHRTYFGRVTLDLIFGDVAELLPGLQASVDAWFLDGFAPAKNPDMWSDAVLQQIARLSAPGASFATFTAAGAVKRGLEANGFAVEKVPGFGKKREMLVGKLEGVATPSLPLPPRSPTATHPPSTATVIGGGIAGATVARALAERGVKVTVHEKNTIASGASGNVAAVLYPQLTKQYGAAMQWYFAGYGLARRMLKRAPVGMLKIGNDTDDEKKLRERLDALQLDADIARWIEADEASEKLGADIKRGGVWFEQGTWLDPQTWCRDLLSHANITVRQKSEITRGEGLAIICAAEVSAKLLPQLKLGVSAGQVSEIRGLKLKAILCHKGYAIPNGMIGATYDHDDLSCAVTEANHRENVQTLRTYLPGDYEVVSGRTSLRASTPDRLPYVGQVENDLWVSTGHGSRGMISAPLAAEVIASQICGEPLPVTTDVLKAVDPRRFYKASNSVASNPSRAKTGS